MEKNVLGVDVPVIQTLLQSLFDDPQYIELARMGGLTNRTYKVVLDTGDVYVIRIPGEGTEMMINRRNEKCSTELACSIGIDAPILYFGDDGKKVSAYIQKAQTMSAKTLGEKENLIRAARVLRRLHTCGRDTGVLFEVFDMVATYEKIISDYHIPLYEDYEMVRTQIMQIKWHVDNQGTAERVPCHNDPLCENWVLDDSGRMYLIDWEYAGMNDGMWDLADISIEAGLNMSQDAILLEAYFERPPSETERERFNANKLYLDFLWTLWGKTRIPFDGDEMESYAQERYVRLKRNLQTHIESI